MIIAKDIYSILERNSPAHAPGSRHTKQFFLNQNQWMMIFQPSRGVGRQHNTYRQTKKINVVRETRTMADTRSMADTNHGEMQVPSARPIL